MDKTRVAIITTTINVPNVLKIYEATAPEGVELSFIVAGDVVTPSEARDLVIGLGGTYIGVDGPLAEYWDYNEVVGVRTIQRRNLALLHALSEGNDIIITIDDDNEPFAASSYINEVVSHLNYKSLPEFVNGIEVTRTSTGWWNPGSILVPEVTHRGFPLNQRHRDHTEHQYHRSDGVTVGVVAGMCIGDPDIDAIERIVNQPRVGAWGHDPTITLDVGTWAPFNTQNTAYTWHVAPFMQVLKGVGRYDDIWMSYIARKIMDYYYVLVRYGRPTAVQKRNDHDLFEDMLKEMHGYEYTPRLIQVLRDMEISDLADEPIEMLKVIYDRLYLEGFWGPDTQACNIAWVEDVYAALSEGATVNERYKEWVTKP